MQLCFGKQDTDNKILMVYFILYIFILFLFIFYPYIVTLKKTFTVKRRPGSWTHLVRVQIDALKTDPGFVSDRDKDGIWVLEAWTALVLEHTEDGEICSAVQESTHLRQSSERFLIYIQHKLTSIHWNWKTH